MYNEAAIIADNAKKLWEYMEKLVSTVAGSDKIWYATNMEIYEYVKAHEEEFKDVEILIQMRYMDAVLTNRAGSAPNKKNDTN